MSRPGDYSAEMMDQPLLTDADVEDLLRGTAPARTDLGAVADAISELALLADEPPPPASPALAAVLAGGPVTGDADLDVGVDEAAWLGPTATPDDRERPGRRRLRLAGRVAAMSLGAKFVLASGAAAAGLTGAAATDALPRPVQNAVAGLVSAVTPFELPRHDGGEPGSETPPATSRAPEHAPGRDAGADSDLRTGPGGEWVRGEGGQPSSGADPTAPPESPRDPRGGTTAPGGPTEGTAPGDVPAPDGSPPPPASSTPTAPSSGEGAPDKPSQAPDASPNPAPNPAPESDTTPDAAPSPPQGAPSSAPESGVTPPTAPVPATGSAPAPPGGTGSL